MKTIPLLALLLLASIPSALAKRQLCEGYYLTLKGDTVKGFIEVPLERVLIPKKIIVYKSSYKLREKISYYKTKTSEPKKMTEKELNGFGFVYQGENYHYRVVTEIPDLLNKRNVVMVVYDGKLKAYEHFGTTHGTAWSFLYLQKEGAEKYEKVTQSGGFTGSYFAGKASEYLSDCPALAEKIKSQEFKEKDMPTIGKEYDACK